MTATELNHAYAQLPEQEKLLFASLVAADQMRRGAQFAASLDRRHRDMDAGKKWSHEMVCELHRKLELMVWPSPTGPTMPSRKFALWT